MGGIRRRLLNNATSYEELWLGVSVNTVCRKSNDVMPFGKLDWTPQVIDGRCTMGQAEQVAIKKTVEIGLNFRSTHWGRLTYWRSAAGPLTGKLEAPGSMPNGTMDRLEDAVARSSAVPC